MRMESWEGILKIGNGLIQGGERIRFVYLRETRNQKPNWGEEEWLKG